MICRSKILKSGLMVNYDISLVIYNTCLYLCQCRVCKQAYVSPHHLLYKNYHRKEYVLLAPFPYYCHIIFATNYWEAGFGEDTYRSVLNCNQDAFGVSFWDLQEMWSVLRLLLGWIQRNIFGFRLCSPTGWFCCCWFYRHDVFWGTWRLIFARDIKIFSF